MRRKKTGRIRGAVILTLLALGCVLGFVKAYEPYRDQEIHFSVEEQFLEENTLLKLSTLLPSEIYYTLDGSEPSRTSFPYQGAITLAAGETCRGIPVRAIAYHADGHVSEICTRTYFVGKDVKDRFDTVIVEITGDPEDLFDYENGILVSGKLRDDYVLEHPDEWISDRDPANYNVRGYEGEREVQVELWEADGSRLLNQKLGLRVNGGMSRGLDVKSLRLIAREDYGSKRIPAALFPGQMEVSDSGEPLLSKRVVLRNHGNDQEYGYLRNELGEQLAADAGFPSVQRFRAASVWSNGEYYGFEWMEDYFDGAYLNNLYGATPDNGTWRMAEPFREDATELSEEDQEAKADLQQVMSYYHEDLTDDAVYAELCSRLDMDNFLRYCAVELCVANVDWPDNNCKGYRWYSDIDDYSQEGTDGKWRFLLYDLDLSMGRIPETSYDTPAIGLVLGVESNGWRQELSLLKALLKRTDIQEQFTTILEEYVSTAFSTENALKRLDEISTEMDGEMQRQIRVFAEKEAEKEGQDVEEVYGFKILQHELEIDTIREFWENRPAVLKEEIKKLPAYLRQLEDQAE